MNNFLKILLVLMLQITFLFALDLTFQEKQYLKNNTPLKVQALSTFPPFNFSENGHSIGYTIDYMKLVSNYLGVEVQFTKPESFGKTISMFKEGKIDILPHIAKNKKRTKYIEYTDFNHLEYLTGVVIRKDEDIKSMVELKGKTIAVIDKSFIHIFIKDKYPNQNLLVLPSSLDTVEAVSSGKADASIGSIPTMNFYIQKSWLNNLKTVVINDIGLPTKVSLPMGVQKENLILKSILDKVEADIPYNEIVKLKEKWLGINMFESYRLSNAEKQFLEKKKSIKFLVRASRPPFEFEENGKAVGIGVDYINKIAQKLGFKAEFILKDITFKEAYNNMKKENRYFDTMLFMVKNDKREKEFVFGNIFLSYPMMIISHKNSSYIGKTSDLSSKKVVIERGFLTNKWLKRDYPNLDIIPAKTTQDALYMVNNEEADAYIGNMAVANYMMIHKGFDNLKIVAPSDYGTINYSFVSPKEFPLLASIMSKGFKKISPSEHSIIQQKWFSSQTINKIDYTLIWQIVIFFSLIIFGVVWYNRKLKIEKHKVELIKEKLKEQNKKLHKLSTTDKLTGLDNRLKIDEFLFHQLKLFQRYKTPFSIILLDIDNFKMVNDFYGHIAGDEVLVEVAQRLKNSVRVTDSIGRWGGEEFIVICTNVESNITSIVAENLRKSIESEPFKIVGKVTISLGITHFNDTDTLDSAFQRVDRALYEAKKSGKNRVIEL